MNKTMKELTSRLEDYSSVLDVLDGVKAHPNVSGEYVVVLEIVKQLHEKVAVLKERLEDSKRLISRQQSQVAALNSLTERMKHIADNVNFYAPLVASEEMDSRLMLATPEPNGRWAHSSPIPSPTFLDASQKSHQNTSSIRPSEVTNQTLLPKTPKPAKDLDVAISYISTQDFSTIPAYMKGRIRLDEINSFIGQFNAVLNQKIALLKKPKKSVKLKKEMDLITEWKEQNIPALSGQYFLSAKDFVSLSNYKFSKKDFSIITILRHTQRIKESRMGWMQKTLELCKENIQPLKQGRRANKLGLALLALNDVEIQEQLLKEREQYELEIMTYDGPDPIEPRYSYVHWIEQSCPKHGREVNLIPLLEDTIMLFKEDDRYKQDTRFIELIIKYIEMQDNPIELFQMVYAQGLGTKCASFYKAWADQLDMNNDLQRADQVFQLGLSEEAEPREVLEQAHLRFQMSVGRRMMMGQLASKEKPVSTETAERQRQVLGKIKKGGSLRPSSGLPGKLPLSANRAMTGNSATTFTVFQEDENGVPLPKSSKAKLNVNAESTQKENTMKPGPWNQGYKRKPAPPMPSTPVPSTPTFQVLVDEEDETVNRPVPATPVPSNVLKARKAEMKHHAQELFKSPHPNSKPHLPVFEAFAGGREFCFEELRWAYLCKKMGQAKSGLLDETPLKTNRNFTTPCKSSLKSPAPETPLCMEQLSLGDKTPACSRFMYPIMESPPSRDTENSDNNQRNPVPSVSSDRRLETPMSAVSIEDGVYAIPNTPASSTLSSTATPSLSRAGPSDTPRNIISRPKIPKPVKTAPFTIYTDD